MKNWLASLSLHHWLFAGISLLLLVGLGIFLGPGTDSGAASKPTSDAAASKAPASVVMEVRGMYCSSCQARVERSLRDVEGVKEVDVTHEESRARIWAAEGISLEDKTLIETVEEAGYKAGPIRRPEGGERR